MPQAGFFVIKPQVPPSALLGLARYLEWLHEVPCKQTSDMQYLPITENSITLSDLTCSWNGNEMYGAEL